MRGGFRPGRDGDDHMSNARRHLQAALGGSNGTTQDGTDQEGGTGGPSNILQAGNIVAAAAAAPQVPSQQLGQLPLSSLTASIQLHPSLQRELQPSQIEGLLQAQRLTVQRAHLEAQLHAQAQAQAQLRMRALLDQEAQTEEQIRLIQARQRQRQQEDFLLAALSMPPAAASVAQANSAARGLAGTSGTLSFATAAAASLPLSMAGSRQFGGLGPLVSSPSLSLARNTVPEVPLATNQQWSRSNTAAEESLVGKILQLESDRAKDLALQMNSLTARAGTTSLIQEYDTKETTERGELKVASDDALTNEERKDQMSDDEYFQTIKNPREAQPEKGAEGDFRRTREPFPIKLYRILHEAEKNGQSDIVSFFPHGRAFAVHKSKEFIQDIMPKYFGAGRMNTFLKQLNLYDFRRITEGPDKGGYFHPKFAFGKRHKCKEIKRKKTNIKAAPPSPGSEASRQSPTDLTKLYQGQSELSSPEAQKMASTGTSEVPSMPAAYRSPSPSDDEDMEETASEP